MSIDMTAPKTTLEERSRRRRGVIVAHRARSVADAEVWDLEFWLRQTPEERLSALIGIRREVEMVKAARAARRRPGR
jgi:hypothetical protein